MRSALDLLFEHVPFLGSAIELVLNEVVIMATVFVGSLAKHALLAVEPRFLVTRAGFLKAYVEDGL